MDAQNFLAWCLLQGIGVRELAITQILGTHILL